jgi:predicted acylesterase/phospholipase RssA
MSGATDGLLDCDVIFRGGVTSGVIYPGTVAALAEKYRFVNIGGASAGAIAAGVAAAAEYGRRQGKADAFQEVEKLAAEVAGGPGSHTSLRKLFHADARLKPLDLLVQLLMRFGIGGGLGITALPAALVGVLVGVASGSLPWGIVAALGALAATIGVVAWQVLSVLPRCGFGLSPGVNPRAAQTAEGLRGGGALMDWMHATMQRLAGREVGRVPDGATPAAIAPAARPLTMGDLWGEDAARRNIDLLLTTTNLSQQLPHQFPFLERGWPGLFFRPDELRRVLPQDVVRWMIAAAQPTEAGLRADGFLRLPVARDLPVLFGVRLSLSFPGLIAAVPLHAPDHDEAIARKESAGGDAPALSPCWFSDGGITSNFPIHVFDSVLPSRPTFCVNLRAATKAELLAAAAPPPAPAASAREAALRLALGTDPLVSMARSNRDKFAAPFLSRIGTSLPAFLGAIVSTARNGTENELMLMPGHRDRIIHIATSDAEGGLNLGMPPETITALSARGRRAGELLRSRFHPEGAARRAGFELGWENHRWLRFRAAAAALERTLADFRTAWTAPAGHAPRYADLPAAWSPAEGGGRATPSYAWANAEAADAAARGVGHLVDAAEGLRREAEALAGGRPVAEASVFDGMPGADGRPKRGAPRPKLGLKMRPLGADPRALATYR